MGDIETGFYRLKRKRSFRWGDHVFTRPKGSTVELLEVDLFAGEVLINTTWLPISEMKYLEKINTNL